MFHTLAHLHICCSIFCDRVCEFVYCTVLWKRKQGDEAIYCYLFA